MKSYGNRMEIVRRYAGASFANPDSADLAEIPYGNRMEIVWNMPAQVSQIPIWLILRATVKIKV